MDWTLFRAFLLTYCAVLSGHFSRECFAMVRDIQLKIQFKEEAGFSTTWLGVLDTTYFFSYAVGLFISGFIEDKLDPKKVVSCGMTVSGATLVSISAMGASSVKQEWCYVPLFLLNGFCQSTIFPGTSAIMGKFFTSESTRGKVFAVWGSSVCIGNMTGAIVTAFLQESLHAEWQQILLLVATLLVISATSLCLLLPVKHLVITETQQRSDSRGEEEGTQSCLHAVMLPGYILSSVLLYAGCYGFQKMTHQGLGMWIPFFFEERFHDSEELAGALETLYEVGGLLGCIFMGVLCDLTGYRALVVGSVLWLMLPVMYVFNLPSPGATWFYTLVVFFAGFGINGSSNFLSSVIPVDLAQSNPHAGEVLATIVGVIDGCGSFGAAVGGSIIGALADMSWDYVFMFIMSALTLSSLFLLPRMVRESRPRDSREIEISKQ